MESKEEKNFYKRKVLLLGIAILIVIGLIVFLYFFGKGNSCDQCEIEFKNTRVSGMDLDNPIILKEKMNNLFEGLSKGKCLIKFDRVQGYYNAN